MNKTFTLVHALLETLDNGYSFPCRELENFSEGNKSWTMCDKSDSEKAMLEVMIQNSNTSQSGLKTKIWIVLKNIENIDFVFKKWIELSKQNFTDDSKPTAGDWINSFSVALENPLLQEERLESGIEDVSWGSTYKFTDNIIKRIQSRDTNE